MHLFSLTLGCHHHQISAHCWLRGFAGHHRVWLSAAAKQQQRALHASVSQRPLCDKSAPKSMQRLCDRLHGACAAAASTATTCIIQHAGVQEKLQQAARIR